MPKTALIIGASSGVGLALAKRSTHAGQRVLATGRRDYGAITDPPFSDDHYLACDLAATDAAVAAVQVFLDQHGIKQLDLVLYAAGFAYYGQFGAQSSESIESMTAVNAITPIALTRALTPAYAVRQWVYISSIAAFAPAPQYAVYAASKALITSFAKNLHIEEATRRRIQCVHLGPVRTDFHQRAGVPAGQFDDARWDSADETAAKIFQQIRMHHPNLFTGMSGRLLRALDQRLPEVLTCLQSGRAARPKDPPRHVVVTGAANGIGAAIVNTYASMSAAAITLIDRDVAGGEALAQSLTDRDKTARFITADLTDYAAHPALIDSLRTQPPIDLLVLNAGINLATPFFSGNGATDRAMIAVNFLSPMHMVHQLLAARRLADGGTIVLISSLSKFISYPGAAVYGGSKDGLHAFAQSLREILKPRNINVLIVYPGPTETDQARANSPGDPATSKRMPPGVLAQKIHSAAARGKRWLIPGASNQIIVLIARIAPGLIQRIMRRIIYEAAVKSQSG